MKIISDGKVKEIVEEWYKTTPLYEALVIMGAKAEQKNTLRQVVELADSRIEALQKLLAYYRIGKYPTEKLLDQLEKSGTKWEELKRTIK